MPINFDSPNLTPQQVLNSIDNGSLKDSLNRDKIGRSQVLYVKSGEDGNTVRGQKFHWVTTSEADKAKEAVISWVKGLGLPTDTTDMLVKHLSEQEVVTGGDLKAVAHYAGVKPVEDRDESSTELALKRGGTTAKMVRSTKALKQSGMA